MDWCYTSALAENFLAHSRRGGRAAECGGLLNRCRGQNSYRGFESPPLRHSTKETLGYKFFLHTGGRDREVTFESWSDINFEKKTYTIRAKPDAEFFPKNHESRTVPLQDSLIKLLKKAQQNKKSDRWIFANKYGKPENHSLRKLKRIALNAGLNCGHCKTTINVGRYKPKVVEVSCKTHPVCEHIYLHRLRKTCATRWHDAGIPMRTLQHFLGHKNLETTMLSPQFLSGIDVNWRQPYVQQWNIDIQRQVSRSVLFDVGYYGNRALHLTSGLDINQPRPGAYLSAGVLPQGPVNFGNGQFLNYVRPRGYGSINISSPRFQSNYHSLQAQWQWRPGDNNLVTLNYTWSHALTDAPSQYNTPQNAYDIRAEYGPADFDRRHIFTGSYIYHFPFYRLQNGISGHLFGGWELSGIVYAQTGLWLTVNGVHIDPAGLGLADFNSGPIFDARPDQLGNPNHHAPHTVMHWFDGSLFADPPADGIRPGNAPRGSILGPGVRRWDASLFKNTKIGEQVNVQFRAEASNVLNHTNFDQIGTAFLLDFIRFGKVLSARDPRIIQLGLKVTF